MWINAFLFRVASLLRCSSNSKLVLNVEENALPVAQDPSILNFLFGSVNFTAILTTEAHAGETSSLFLHKVLFHSFLAEFLLMNGPGKLKTLSAQDHVLLVMEARGPNQRLESHVPQAICEMYACARHIRWVNSRHHIHSNSSFSGKTIFRGALTNGHKWIFLVLILNEDGNGGKYFQSHCIRVLDVISSVSHEGSSLTAAIIAHWVGKRDCIIADC